jgi:ABC-2 type transport system permease protein
VKNAFWKTVSVAWKELRQIRRDRRTLLILMFVPAFFLLVYGYALNFDIRHVRLAVQDNDSSAASRELVSAFVNSGYFDLVAEAPDARAIDRLVNRGAVRAVLVIPSRFGASVESGQPTSVQVLVDGDNANTASTVVGYALSLITSQSRR